MSAYPTPLNQPRDNLFGVCAAIGQAFGFDPLILRILFMAAVLVDVRWAMLGYALAGLAVLMALAVERMGAGPGRATPPARV